MIPDKKTYDFDTPIDRSSTNSIKWGTRAVKREALLPLSVADMDFAVDKSILEAIRKRLDHPVFGYEFNPENLNDAFCAWQSRRHDFTVQKESIVHLSGVVNGLALSILTFSEPDDGVVIQPPVYPPFFGVVNNNARKLLLNPLKYHAESRTWTMDFEGLEKIFIYDKPAMMLLCSPHNPVGRVWRLDELKELAELCCQYGVILVSDDIHSDFILQNHSYTPLAHAVDHAGPGYIQLLSPAKTFNIPGIGLAFALVPDPDQKKALQNRIEGMGLSRQNIMARTVVPAAYEHGEKWFEEVKAYIEENHRIFRKEMGRLLPRARVSEAEGSFVTWVDFREFGLSHRELAHIIRHEAKLLLFDGLSFGDNGEYFFRLNLACPRKLLQQAVNSLARALAMTRKRQTSAISLDNVVDRRCCG